MSLSLRTRRTGAVGVTSGIGGCKRWLPFGLFGKFLLDALGTLGGSTEGASAGSSAGAPALLLVLSPFLIISVKSVCRPEASLFSFERDFADSFFSESLCAF